MVQRSEGGRAMDVESFLVGLVGQHVVVHAITILGGEAPPPIGPAQIARVPESSSLTYPRQLSFMQGRGQGIGKCSSTSGRLWRSNSTNLYSKMQAMGDL